MRRISIKALESRIDTINGLTDNKYELRLFTTTGCGVDIKVNGKWVTSDEMHIERNLTNKEAMEYLNNRFGQEIREIVISLNK
jgi:hypothetical protein